MAFTSDLQKLGSLIEIALHGGHAVAMRTDVMLGSVGPSVTFGVDAGGSWVSLFGGQRLTPDDAMTVIADLTNAVCEAKRMEWAKDHGLRQAAPEATGDKPAADRGP